METGQFYCVGCQELKDAASGHRVFRTGYFRLVYPLGYCLVCRKREAASRSAASADGPETVFEPRDAGPRTPPAAMSDGVGPTAVRTAAV